MPMWWRRLGRLAGSGVTAPSRVAAGSPADRDVFGVHGDPGLLAVVLVHAWMLAVGVALLRRR
jgi:hypothetical protein